MRSVKSTFVYKAVLGAYMDFQVVPKEHDALFRLLEDIAAS